MNRSNAWITQRDLEILRTLFECRIATTHHVAALNFEGRYEAAKKRVQKLKSAGILAERPRRVSEPAVLTLTTPASRILTERGCLDRYPALAREEISKRARVSDMTIHHELAVMDIRCAVVDAVRSKPQFKLIEFSTWPLLHSFMARPSPTAAPMLVRPDGFFRVAHVNEAHSFAPAFFMELDRGTESQQTLVTRAMCYRHFYQSGGLASWYGGPKQAFKDFPFRTLIVVSNEERRNNLALRLLNCNPPILSQVYLAVLDSTIRDPLGQVWTTPTDYRAAVAGTEFDAAIPSTEKIYRRRPERETHVARTIQMRSILPPETAS